jgi:hypothetical protein
MLVRKVTAVITENTDAETILFLIKNCFNIFFVYDDQSVTTFEKLESELSKVHFVPIQGKYLMDCHYELHGNFLHIKVYDEEEILELILSSFVKKFKKNIEYDENETTSTCSTHDFTRNYHVKIPLDERECDFMENIKNRDLLIEDDWKISYPDTISFLCEIEKIQVRESTSFLATDTRIFSIDGENWYEVDILGTTFGEEISCEIENLYSSSIKL